MWCPPQGLVGYRATTCGKRSLKEIIADEEVETEKKYSLRVLRSCTEVDNTDYW
jgi:hypothetical protein